MDNLKPKFGISIMRFLMLLYLLVLTWLLLWSDSDIAKLLNERIPNLDYFIGYVFTTVAVIVGIVEQYNLDTRIKEDSLIKSVHPLYPRWEIVKCCILVALQIVFWISMFGDLVFVIRLGFLIQIAFVPQFFNNTIYCGTTYFIHKGRKYYYHNIAEYKKGEYNTFDVVIDDKQEVIHYDYENERKILVKALERIGS